MLISYLCVTLSKHFFLKLRFHIYIYIEYIVDGFYKYTHYVNKCETVME